MNPPPSSFVSHQIQQSQNRLAARVLFPPNATQRQRQGVHFTPTPAHQPESSTLLQRPSNETDSDVEPEVRAGLERLDLSNSSSSQSGSQSPRAGPHSKTRNIHSKPKGGAKDIWSFYEKSETNRHRCIFCK